MKMPLQFFIAFTLVTAPFELIRAAEADNFSERATVLAKLEDSLPVLDSYVNAQIEGAVAEANAAGTCKTRSLYLSIWDRLGHNPISKAEKFAEQSPQVDKFLVNFDQSIYGLVPTFVSARRTPVFADLFILTGWFSASIRLANQVVGVDKLGHFFGQGWDYFLRGDLRSALEHGHKDEIDLDGFVGSGVYSYGDLAANYDGLRFWIDVLGGNKPYVSCREGKFKVDRKFTFANYISASWDEAINCSTYVNAEYTNAVGSRLSALKMSCPVQPASCSNLVRAVCSNMTVSPSCFKEAGVDLAAKKKECDAYLATNPNWKTSNPINLTEDDYRSFNVDKLLGISAMPFHYIWRDLRAAFKSEP